MALNTNPITVNGLEDVLDTLNRSVRGIKFRTRKGMIAAGLLIQRKAQQKVPVDLGNLRSSAFTIWGSTGGTSKKSFEGSDKEEMAANHSKVVSQERLGMTDSITNPQVEVGFTANYAMYVHEDPIAKHTVGERKFLERAIIENLDGILYAIENEAWKGAKGK